MSKERDFFNSWFASIIFNTESSFQRDVLRDSKEQMWQHWQERAKEYDAFSPGNIMPEQKETE